MRLASLGAVRQGSQSNRREAPYLEIRRVVQHGRGAIRWLERLQAHEQVRGYHGEDREGRNGGYLRRVQEVSERSDRALRRTSHD